MTSLENEHAALRSELDDRNARMAEQGMELTHATARANGLAAEVAECHERIRKALADLKELGGELDVARDVTAEYRFSLLNLVAPALRESTETCLKLSEQGLLNLMVKFASPETPDRYAFVEFYVCPLVEDDDEAFTTTQGG